MDKLYHAFQVVRSLRLGFGTYEKDRMPDGQSGLSFEKNRVTKLADLRSAFVAELCACRQFFLTIRTLRRNLRRSALAAELCARL